MARRSIVSPIADVKMADMDTHIKEIRGRVQRLASDEGCTVISCPRYRYTLEEASIKDEYGKVMFDNIIVRRFDYDVEPN